jgi:hypothetical protein
VVAGRETEGREDRMRGVRGRERGEGGRGGAGGGPLERTTPVSIARCGRLCECTSLCYNMLCQLILYKNKYMAHSKSEVS